MDTALVLARKVVAAYREAGDLAFGYGQGSVIAGFAPDGALDLSLVWDRAEPPATEDRPVQDLHDGSGGVSVRFFQRDRFWVHGRQVHVLHRTRSEFDGWLDTVGEGHGWEIVTTPTPLYAVAGFAYGALLDDVDGSGGAARERVAAFPQALRERSRSGLAEELASYDRDLVEAARQGDGWLFHEHLGVVHRHAMVAWFAAHGRFCPYPKWLRRWVARFGLDPGIAALERGLWAPPVSLQRRRELFRQMADRILAL
ncbi:MAG TPA: hypothetical protein VI076_13975 [Actinopolymorphaceae bacterium]